MKTDAYQDPQATLTSSSIAEGRHYAIEREKRREQIRRERAGGEERHDSG